MQNEGTKHDDDHDKSSVDKGTLAILQSSEIDQQISTAHKFPRNVKRFREEAMTLVTMDEHTADECIYALPRAEGTIEGPSARFAEIILSCWGNSRAGARVVDDTGKFIVAQGVFHDLQRNVAITLEVQRRITKKNGARLNDDMVGVTGNAASSIALRNAILKGIPKAFWSPIYEEARKTLIGDVRTFTSRREKALNLFEKMGVTPEQVYETLGIRNADDMTTDHLVTLRGFAQALKEGDTTLESIFRPKAKKADDLNERLKTAPDAPQSTQDETVTTPAAETTSEKPADEVKEKPAPKTRAKKPPTQTIGAASIGETAQMGKPGVDEAIESERAQDFVDASDVPDSDFNLE